MSFSATVTGTSGGGTSASTSALGHKTALDDGLAGVIATRPPSLQHPLGVFDGATTAAPPHAVPPEPVAHDDPILWSRSPSASKLKRASSNGRGTFDSRSRLKIHRTETPPSAHAMKFSHMFPDLHAKRQETASRESSTHGAAAPASSVSVPPVSAVSVPVPGAAALPWFPSGIAFAADDAAAARPTERGARAVLPWFPSGIAHGNAAVTVAVAAMPKPGTSGGGASASTSPLGHSTALDEGLASVIATRPPSLQHPHGVFDGATTAASPRAAPPEPIAHDDPILWSRSPSGSKLKRASSNGRRVTFERALPGGYTVGDEVFFTGVSKTWENGNRLVYGDKGEVTSPATEATEGKGDLDVILMKGYV